MDKAEKMLTSEDDLPVYEKLPNGRVLRYKESQRQEWEAIKKAYRDGTLQDKERKKILDELFK